MHFLLEIIIPPGFDVEQSVTDILAPFDENQNDDGGEKFWDFWVIGGRFSGNKLEQSLDSNKLEAFYAELKNRKVTVSGIQCGKQELSPASQIPDVDALWRDMFPESGVSVCPLFNHSNNQYDSKSNLPGDISTLSELPDGYTCSRLITAKPHWQNKGKLEAGFMLSDSIWNGVNHVKSVWDGSVSHGIQLLSEHAKMYKEEYREKMTPKDDWLVITVDYHS